MTDGDVDYSKFSRAQLEEALTRIDRDRYPRNYESLVRELRVRPLETQAPRLPDMREWVPLIGWYQVVAAFALGYHAATTWTFDAHNLPLPTLLFAVVLVLVALGVVALTGIAGLLTVRGHPLGPRLSIIAFVPQIVSITVPGFSYKYVSLIALPAFWSSGDLGVTLSLGSDISVRLGRSDPFFMGVDVFALSAIIVLGRLIRPGLPANNRWRGP